MNLEEIPISRREALGIIASSPLFGCGGDSITGSDSNNDTNGGNSQQDPPGDYTEFSIPRHLTQEYTISGEGGVRFTNGYGTKEVYPVLEASGGNLHSIGDRIKVDLYENDHDTVIFASDTQNRYSAGILFSPRYASKPTAPTNIRLYSKEDMIARKELVMKNIESFVPDWDEDHVINIPGIVYRGDFSLDDLKVQNSLLNQTSTVLTLIPGPQVPVTASISLATTVGSILLEAADGIASLIDEHTSVDMDKYTVFSWYNIPGVPAPILVPVELIEAYNRRNPNLDPKDFFPLTPGNSWNYTSRVKNFSEEVIGTKDINGKRVIVVKNSEGRSEYFGYRNGELKLMGADHPNTGEFYFEPGIVIGDNNLRIGKKYQGTSRVDMPKFPQLRTVITTGMDYLGSEQVSVHAGEFGDCLKSLETGEIIMTDTNTGRNIVISERANHWLARNIGPVKTQIIDGGEVLPETTYELYSAEVNDTLVPKPLVNSKSGLSLTQLVTEAVKQIM